MKVPSRIGRVKILRNKPARSSDERAFLTLQRLEVVNEYKDGTESASYNYDGVLRKWLDAVVLILTADVDGYACVCLRACIRPPLLLRNDIEGSKQDELPAGVLWEIPAGLLEKDEQNTSGVKKRAAIEALEETGYEIDPDDFELFKGAPFLSPGTIPERIYFAHAHLKDLMDRVTPSGDGSPAEDDEGIWWVSLDDAIDMCDRGEIVDAKTKLKIVHAQLVAHVGGIVVTV